MKTSLMEFKPRFEQQARRPKVLFSLLYMLLNFRNEIFSVVMFVLSSSHKLTVCSGSLKCKIRKKWHSFVSCHFFRIFLWIKFSRSMFILTINIAKNSTCSVLRSEYWLFLLDPYISLIVSSENLVPHQYSIRCLIDNRLMLQMNFGLVYSWVFFLKFWVSRQVFFRHVVNIHSSWCRFSFGYVLLHGITINLS